MDLFSAGVVVILPVELLLFNIVKDTDGNKLRIQALFF
jgi:hypothetical protein